MEAGHISQNIYLPAASLGPGSVTVEAFDEVELNRLLGVDGLPEIALYAQPVGAVMGPQR